MKKNRITVIALFAILLIVACGGDYFYMFFEKSYILDYTKVTGYKAQKVADDWIFLGTLTTPYETLCSFTNEQTKDIFDKFSKSHGDTAYNKTKSLCVGSKANKNNPMIPPEQAGLGMDIQSIVITSDAEYDDNHPVGTPLNDLVRCVSYSLMEYIRQGYPEDFPIVTKKNEGEEIAGVSIDIENYLLTAWQFGYWTRQDKLLSEYTAEDFKLINRYEVFPANSGNENNELHPVALFQFTVLPTLAKEHNFKITITGTDMVKENLTFTTQCNMVFE